MATEDIICWLREHAKGADFTWRNVMRMAANRLEQLSKREAVEVVHGRWASRPHSQRALYHIFYCSACDGWRHDMAYEHENMNYCPNCGAKMDGERKDVNEC